MGQATNEIKLQDIADLLSGREVTLNDAKIKLDPVELHLTVPSDMGSPKLDKLFGEIKCRM